MASAKSSEKGRGSQRPPSEPTRLTASTGWTGGKGTGKKTAVMAIKGVKDEVYKERCKMLKKRCGELEEQNGQLARRLQHSKRLIARLRLERCFLFDKLGQFTKVQHSVHSSSSSDSSSTEDSSSDSDSSEAATPARVTETPKPDKSNRKKKADKDPHAPKRPANAFFMFCQHHRAQAQEEFTDLRHPDITKLLGQRWQLMSEQEKQPYYEMYENDKTRYARDLKQYTQGESGHPADVTPDQSEHAKAFLSGTQDHPTHGENSGNQSKSTSKTPKGS